MQKIMKLILTFFTSLLCFTVVFAEDKITTGTIDVYSISPLPSIGLPKNQCR